MSVEDEALADSDHMTVGSMCLGRTLMVGEGVGLLESSKWYIDD